MHLQVARDVFVIYATIEFSSGFVVVEIGFPHSIALVSTMGIPEHSRNERATHRIE
jgi:hypothetical protein